jgi:hypothetical protein
MESEATAIHVGKKGWRFLSNVDFPMRRRP